MPIHLPLEAVLPLPTGLGLRWTIRGLAEQSLSVIALFAVAPCHFSLMTPHGKEFSPTWLQPCVLAWDKYTAGAMTCRLMTLCSKSLNSAMVCYTAS
jgi:hypothetical protein